MSKFISKARLVSNNLIRLIRSIFWKKDDSVVLIGAWFGEKFADNSRYLFQYLADNKETLGLSHVVWVTRNVEVLDQLKSMGYEVYMMDSEESIRYHKIAKYHIVCNVGYTSDFVLGDIEGKYSFRSKRINLWHGTGALKGVARSSNEYMERKRRHRVLYWFKEHMSRCCLYRLLYQFPGGWGDCYQLATAPIQVRTLGINYGRPSTKCIITSYPRNCLCPRLLPEEEKVLEQMKLHRHVILYLPTFRTNTAFSFSGLAEEMGELLCKKDILWIEKAHSADMANRENGKTSEYILRLSPEFDINVLLPHITLLVTDYSSVRMDAMYQEKATLFYVPDFEEYKNGDNGFMADPDEVMCGPRLYTPKELRDAIETYCDAPEQAKSSNYEQIRSRYWSENRSLSEIWEDICKAVI